MAKLTALSALLGCTLALADNKISLSEEQASKIEDALDKNAETIAGLNSTVAERDKTIAELQASIARKDKTIDELRKEPASSTGNVVDTQKDEPDPYAPVSEADALAASRTFMEASL